MTSVSPSHILVLVDAPLAQSGALEHSPDFLMLINRLKTAIATEHSPHSLAPKVTVASIHAPELAVSAADLIIPLTLDVPSSIDLPARALYDLCRQVDLLRQQVQEELGVATGNAQYWLPIVNTGKGALFAEVIGLGEANRYIQPVHLSDRWRQPLYRCARQILNYLNAPPSVYLLQFGFEQQALVFDRLFPYPALPAIASIGVQTPDLLTCHWRCLTQQPILDVAIAAPVPYVVYDPAIAPE